MSTPTRAFSVFSDEDFKLLKEAVRHWIQTNDESDLTAKYANLYHRLGRAAGTP